MNSAFFCLPCEVCRASHAVKLLGLDTLRALVLTAHVFEQFESHVLSAEDMQQISDHSLAVSNSARKIGAFSNTPISARRTSLLTAGMLHDCRKLILASTLGARYGEVLEYGREAGVGNARPAPWTDRGLFVWCRGGCRARIVEAVAWITEPAGS